MIYTSARLSLAVLEVLVHLDVSELPDSLVARQIETPDRELERLETALLDPKWDAYSQLEGKRSFPPLVRTRAIGDRWVTEARSLALEVRSAAIPMECNVLLNPGHPKAASLRVVREAPFRFNARLRWS